MTRFLLFIFLVSLPARAESLIDIRWESAGSGEVEVYRAEGHCGERSLNFVKIAGPLNSKEYSDGVLKPGQAYCYKIEAIDAPTELSYVLNIPQNTGKTRIRVVGNEIAVFIP